MSEWQPIETAPKKIIRRESMISGPHNHEHGAFILAHPVSGRVAVVHWWQCSDEPDRACNFLDEGGNAAYPSMWMPLPKPPRKKLAPTDERTTQ